MGIDTFGSWENEEAAMMRPRSKDYVDVYGVPAPVLGTGAPEVPIPFTTAEPTEVTRLRGKIANQRRELRRLNAKIRERVTSEQEAEDLRRKVVERDFRIGNLVASHTNLQNALFVEKDLRLKAEQRIAKLEGGIVAENNRTNGVICGLQDEVTRLQDERDYWRNFAERVSEKLAVAEAKLAGKDGE